MAKIALHSYYANFNSLVVHNLYLGLSDDEDGKLGQVFFHPFGLDPSLKLLDIDC